MAKLTQAAFLRATEGKRIDVRDARSRAALAGVNVEKADRDGDGTIHGRREMSVLFREIDRFDTDGHYSSVRVSGSDGAPTGIADKVAAVGDLGGVNALRALANMGTKPVLEQRPRSKRDEVLHVGLNPDAHHEVASLQQKGVPVTAVENGKGADLPASGCLREIDRRQGGGHPLLEPDAIAG